MGLGQKLWYWKCCYLMLFLPATPLLRVFNASHVTMKAKHSKCISSESASSEASLIQKFHSLSEFINRTGWSVCKTQGRGRMEIPKFFHEHNFYLVKAFVRAMVKLNWGGISFRKELVYRGNSAWIVELLLGDKLWYSVGLCGQKWRLSLPLLWKGFGNPSLGPAL